MCFLPKLSDNIKHVLERFPAGKGFARHTQALKGMCAGLYTTAWDENV